MKAILVDDERLALVHMEKMLGRYESITVIGKFQLAGEAIKQAKELQPDVAFLDIHMPEYTGLQAAVLLQEVCPAIQIVFVTAHDQYALQAFELDAIDYLTKPPVAERLDMTVERLFKRRGEQGQVKEGSSMAYGINCFQTLRFQYKDRPAELPKWRTANSQELFAYMLHNRGEVVRKSTLLELLWPELDKKRAMTQLYTAIYIIRQCLQKMNVDITIVNLSIQEGYVLDIGQVSIETELWERELAQISDSLEESHPALGKVLERYEGDYLKDYDYIWAEPERERLRKLWLFHARRLSRFYSDKPDLRTQSIKLLEKIQAFDPYNEEEGVVLLRLYDEAGEYDKVTASYRRLYDAYMVDLGIGMPKDAEQWFEDWKSKRERAEMMP
ncbi:response regulator [Paenibacillus harenae]|uniref:response regulator n=1 Tax=Paenibacillus harenae TaxID=306543 RepID=UPI0027917FEF|nr:response regulator [Paenibacillus harenae]MDQ0062078.1 two-component SAPR family response regulator [Paenibacillus harenae]